MKKIFLSLLILISTCFSATYAQGVGVVSRNEIYKSLPSLIRDIQFVDSMRKKYETEVKFEGAVIQESVEKLVSTYQPKDNESLDILKKRMSVSDTVLLDGYLKRNVELTKKRLAKEKELVDMQKAKIEPTLRKVEAAIKTVSEEKKLDMMFFSEDIGNTLAYVNIKRNFTKEVIAILKK